MFNKIGIVIGVVILGALGFAVFGGTKPAEKPLAGVQQGSEYHSTSTNFANAVPSGYNLKSGTGVLGSVIFPVAGAAASGFDLLDATTTNITLRGNVPTSSLIIASFGASQTVGTYVYDVIFYNGLTISKVGTINTSTITWR